MKRLLIVLLLFVLVAFSAAQTTSQTSSKTAAIPAANTEQEIRKVLSDWLAAEGAADSAALGRLISPQFLGMGPGGNPVTQHDLVPSTGEDRPPAFQGATLGETTIQAQGDTAVALSKLLFKAPQPGQLRFSMVFKRQPGGQWQIISAHLSRQAAE